MTLPRSLLRRDVVLGYIINSYAGVDGSPPRREWIWEEGNDILIGNTEAFVLHLGKKFGVNTTSQDASELHRIMRELGEVIRQYDNRASPDPDSQRAGVWMQPEPDSKILRTRKAP